MAGLIVLLLQLYSFILFARILLSWFPNVDYSNPIVRFLHDVTEPVLQPVRNFLQQQFPDMGPFDFSPIVVFIGIWILQSLVWAVIPF
ncbi:MAG: hypothetical protein Kow00117_14650 [Phototrophicales bacterium]|nr:MAG: YggT family protein [Chloroflexota bacterium]